MSNYFNSKQNAYLPSMPGKSRNLRLWKRPVIRLSLPPGLALIFYIKAVEDSMISKGSYWSTWFIVFVVQLLIRTHFVNNRILLLITCYQLTIIWTKILVMTLLTIQMVLAILSMFHQRIKTKKNELYKFNIVYNKKLYVIHIKIAFLMLYVYHLLLSGLIMLCYFFCTK